MSSLKYFGRYWYIHRYIVYLFLTYVTLLYFHSWSSDSCSLQRFIDLNEFKLIFSFLLFFSFLPKTEEKIQRSGGTGVVCSVIVPLLYSAQWRTNLSLLLINKCVCVIMGVPHLWPFSNTQDVALKVCVWFLSLLTTY